MSFSWEGKKVLVTGGTGFIGAHVCHALVALDADVTILSRPTSNLSHINDILPNIKNLPCNLGSLPEIERAIIPLQPSVIFHLAAEGVLKDGHTLPVMTSNIEGTFNLLHVAAKLPLQRFVQAGSCFEYGNASTCKEDSLPQPVSAYGVSKLATTLLAQLYATQGVPTTCARIFTVYGPMESSSRMIPSIITKALAEVEIQTTEGNQTRDFVYIDDVVKGLLRMVEVPAAVGKIINLGTGQATAIRNVVQMIVDQTKSPSKIKFGALADRLFDVTENSANIDLAKKILDWTPTTSLAEGLDKTIQWNRAR